MHAALLTLALALLGHPSDEPLPQLATVQSLDVRAISPDRTLGVSFDDEDAWLVDLRTGLPLVGVDSGPYRPGDSWEDARFSHDGRRLTLWSRRGSAALVDVEARRIVNQLDALRTGVEYEGKPDAVGRRLGQVGGEVLVVRALETGGVVGRWACRGEEAFALAPDGSFVVLDAGDGVVRIDLDGKREPVQLAASGVDQVELLPGGPTALLVYGSGARCVELADGRIRAEVEWTEGSWRLRGLDAQSRYAVVSNGTHTVRCLDLDELTLRWEVGGPSEVRVEPHSETVWLSGRGFASAVHDLRTGEELWREADAPWYPGRLDAAGADGSVSLHVFLSTEPQRVDGRTGERLPWPRHARADAWCAGFLDDEVAWVVLRHGVLLAIDAQRGGLLAQRELGAKPTAVHGAGGRVVVADATGTARVFEGRDLEPKARFESGASVRLSTDGTRVGAWGGAFAGLRFVDALDGSVLASHGEDLGEFDMAAWSDDGMLVAASAFEESAHVWHASKPVELSTTLADLRSLAVDPAGRWLALGGTEERVVVLDAKGAERAELTVEGPFPFGLRVAVLAFDPTGAHLVATTGDMGSIQVWRTSDWQRVWMHDYRGGNPGSIQVAFDKGASRVWAWGMTNHTQMQFALASGEGLADLAGSGLWNFASSPDGTSSCATRNGVWVLLDSDGRALLERADLSGRGAVVLDVASDELSGDPRALEAVFVRRGTELAPATRD